jgi:hypothetical protein
MNAGSAGGWEGTVSYVGNLTEAMTGSCCEIDGVELVNMYRPTGERYFGTVTHTNGRMAMSGTLTDPGACTVLFWNASAAP